MKQRLLLLIAGLLLTAGIFSCSPSVKIDGIPEDPNPFTRRAGDKPIDRNNIDAMLRNPERPGLATGWGEQRSSSVIDQDFVRASSKPKGTDAIYYNDKQGIKAMTGRVERVDGLQTAAGGLVEWGVKGRMGFLATYKEYGYGRRLVEGDSDGTYTIAVRNRCKSTLEIVASVDGLDVMDGKTASFSKRGYLVDPGATLQIKGFRTSGSSVAAFKFSSVQNSYANMRHGDTKNVGVIGIAVFTQKGVNPWTWMPAEVQQRGQARAFAEAP